MLRGNFIGRPVRHRRKSGRLDTERGRVRRDGIAVLLVEDDPDHSALLKETLRATGKVRTCAVVRGVEEAVDVLTHQPSPSLVLLDVRLPGRSGLELLDWLRGRPELRPIPVVVLTASSDEADLQRAYQLGANSYLLKPASMQELAALAAGVAEYWGGFNRRPGLG